MRTIVPLRRRYHVERKRSRFYATWVIVSCLSAASHHGAAAAQETDTLGALLGPGVQCLLAPTSAYKPGTVFRINRQHVSYFVNRSLAERIPTHPETASVGVSGRSTVSAGVIGWLLRAGQRAARASDSGGHTIDVELGDLTWEVTDDSQIDEVVDWFSAYRRKRADN